MTFTVEEGEPYKVGKVYVDGQDVYAQDEEALAIFRRRQVGLVYQF